MTKKYDLVIVGGGPSGLMAAKVAGENGLRVALLERITDPEVLTRTVRLGEKAMGMPEGTWQKLLEITLKSPSISNFWKIKTTSIGGRGVEGFKEEFEEGE
jgi:2-polyprenyl-6-methoxyphenol hydroxylase-like FAD-dependent oxidoreductase